MLKKFYFNVRQVILGFYAPYLKEALEIESFGSHMRRAEQTCYFHVEVFWRNWLHYILNDSFFPVRV
jgi:hypothetical protein